MGDDPYRSLAGDVQRKGGFAKDTAPYSEFLWANYFREKVPRAMLTKDSGRATKGAIKLAHSQYARYLPGKKQALERVRVRALHRCCA